MADGFPGALLADRYKVAFALLEMRDGRITSSATYAPSAATGRPVRDDSVFWLGCLSKPMTAAAVLLLVDGGALALADPLRRFMPDLPARAGALTVRELLAHTTPLPRNMPDWISFFDREWLSEPLRSSVLRIRDPDESVLGRRTYSSVGYALLGRLVEVIASCELGAFVAGTLFDVLGMPDTFCINAIPGRDAARVAPVLVRAKGTVSVAFEPALTNAVANSMPFAGFFSTTRDVSRFVRMVLEGGAHGGRNVLREETVARMFHEEVVGQGIHQGLAWFLGFSADDRGGRPSQTPCGFWHTSSSGGLIAANQIDRSAVVILGQGLLESDLMPIRVTEWQHARRVTTTLPAPPATPSRVDAPAWLQQFGSAGEVDRVVCC